MRPCLRYVGNIRCTETRLKHLLRKQTEKKKSPRLSSKAKHESQGCCYFEGHGPEWRLPLESNLVLQLTFISDNTIKVINLILLNEMTSLSHKLLSYLHSFLSLLWLIASKMIENKCFFNEIEFGRIWHRKVTLKTQNLQISILNFKSYVAQTKNF